MGRILYDVNAPGNTFTISKTFGHTSISSAAAADVTTEATGKLLVDFIALRNNAVAVAHTANNIIVSADNDTGATTVISAAGTNLGSTESSVTNTPFVLESGKKLQIEASTTTLTSTGTLTVDVVFKRLEDGASISAA
jgi:hypothetical protein